MKIIKKTTFLFGAFFVFFLLSSCAQNEEKSNTTANNKNLSPKEKLNGTWEIVKATGLYENINLGTKYTFEGTKRFSTKKGIIKNEGDIQHITDSTYSVVFDGMTTEYFFSYSFQENDLIIEAGTEGQVFTLNKIN